MVDLSFVVVGVETVSTKDFLMEDRVDTAFFEIEEELIFDESLLETEDAWSYWLDGGKVAGIETEDAWSYWLDGGKIAGIETEATVESLESWGEDVVNGHHVVYTVTIPLEVEVTVDKE